MSRTNTNKSSTKARSATATPETGSVTTATAAGAVKNKAPQPRVIHHSNQHTNPTPTTRPTDTYIPSYLVDLVPELDSYQKLIDAEKKLDIYLARKKIDIYQSISQWNENTSNTSRSQSQGAFSHYDKDAVKYLRIFISNISENQPWQQENREITQDSDNDAGSNEPSWTLRIEGRLLDDQKVDDANRPKFSSFIQDIAVDFKKIQSDVTSTTENDDNEMTDGSPLLSPSNETSSFPLQIPGSSTIMTNNSNTASTMEGSRDIQENKNGIIDAVEWHFEAKNPVEFDGLDVKRPGNENVNCQITIQPKGLKGKHLEYSRELSIIIGKSKGSFHDAVYSLYKYLLINNLLTNDTEGVSNTNNSNKTRDNSKANGSDESNGERTVVQLDNFLVSLLPKTQEEKQKKDQDGDVNMDLEDASPTTTTTTAVAGEEGKLEEDSNTIKKTMKLSEFLPLVNSHVRPMSPITIDYTIRVDKASTYGELVFDIEVPTIDELQGKPHTDEFTRLGVTLMAELDKFTTDSKSKMDEYDKQINLLQLQLNESASKYQFFHKLSQDPVPVLEEYIASQSSAMKVLSGDEGFNEDTVRRSQFYKDNEAMLFENLDTLLSNGRI